MAYTTINKSTTQFNTKLYTGTGSSNAQTGVGFAPDFLAIKDRNGGASRSWVVVDKVRGATKRLKFDQTSGESTQAEMVKTLDSDGFTLGTSSTSNNNGTNFLGYNWKAGGSGSANTDGSINSTVSVNTTAGFSIVTYTGTGANATVGHGLGTPPKFIITKCLSNTSDWMVYFGDATDFLKFNTTAGREDLSTVWNDTAPTNTVFSLGNNGDVNTSGRTMVAYCFAEKTGYSKIGSYTGNGADGSTTNNFIYTGFKPTWVMVKRASDSGQQWTVCDTVRSPTNVPDSMEWIFPDDTGNETDEDLPYMLSNGFMPRTGHTYMNRNGFGYIYMAFGQSLVGTNNIPATAR